MVTKAIEQADWQRASYLELDSARQPQAIGHLMSQVLARYALPAPLAPATARIAMEEPHYDDEDSHTLAASTAT
jgi:hypothetical protein